MCLQQLLLAVQFWGWIGHVSMTFGGTPNFNVADSLDGAYLGPFIMMWHYDVVAIYLCTETVTISSRGPPNQNFKRQNRSIPKHKGVVFGTQFTWCLHLYASSCYETTIYSYWNMTYLRPLRIVRAGNEGKCISMTTLAILSVPSRTFQCDPCADQHRPCESHLCHQCKPYESASCQCACDHSQFFLYTLWIQSNILIITLQ